MPNGFGYRGGWGFGFRGASPPWPYVGIGRGGLPRCGYYLSGAAGVSWPQAYPTPAAPYAGGRPFYGAYSPGATMANPYAPSMTREQELDFLTNQAEAIKGQLDQIEARIREIEAGTED
jgi:hypothetical protein